MTTGEGAPRVRVGVTGRVLRLVVTRRRAADRFAHPAGRERFLLHVARSGPLVRMGVMVAALVDLVAIGPVARVGPIAAVRRLLAASMELHRTATDVPPGAAAVDHPTGVATRVGRAVESDDDAFDEIVVGSGPGGAIAALHAARRGERVAIIEAGDAASSSASHSTEQLLADFQDGGQELILGRPLVPFAQGAVVGGGSEVNSGLYHRLPAHLRDAWLAAIGATADEWDHAVDDVEGMLPIERQDERTLGRYAASPIPAIAAELGWEHAVIPRWRSYTPAGFQHHGMRATYLSAAVEHGATILTGERVTRVELDRSGGTAIVATDRRHLRCARVVVAAGTTGTPGLLARSGLVPLRRARFGYHAMAKVAVSYPFEINDLVDIDPHQAWIPGDVAKLGVAASTPDLLRSALAGLGLPTDLVSGHLGVYYVSLPALGRGGIVRAGRRLQPWFLADAATLRRLDGLAADLEGAVRATGGTVLAPGRRTLSTVHVFGSLPLGASSSVDANGVVVGTNGTVRVSDASLLPAAPAVNPQGPLMHLATVLAKRAGA